MGDGARRTLTGRVKAAGVIAILAAVAAGCGSSKSSGTAATTTPAGSTGSAAATAQLGASYDTTTAASATVNGAGANSIDPFFERVFYDYHQKNSKTTIQYSPAGSSVGIKDIQQNTVDFGDSEIPMSASDLAKAAGPVLQIPVDLGGVAISYNLPGGPKTVNLDGPTLAAIFDGTITHWNDPRITAVAGATLPNMPIVPVHRADSSGPGWDLDAYLIKTSPTWVAKVGTTKPSKTWPLATIGVGQQLNTGVANYIHQTPGAIGYVEYGYALQGGFTNASLKNAAGAFVAPSLQSIAAAGSHATKLSSSHYSIINGPGAGTYPLANFSWTLVYKKQSDQSKGVALGKLLDYVVTTGQADAAQLGYAPLPAAVVALSEQTLQQMETEAGSPLFVS